MKADISVSVNQRDIDKAVKAIVDKNSEYRQSLKNALDIASLNIESDAKINARNNMPNTRGSIMRGIQRRSGPTDLTADVVSTSRISAYIEFGTGAFARAYLTGKPEWMRRYAWQFKRPRDGYSPARPFLFPAWEKERPRLIERIKRALSK